MTNRYMAVGKLRELLEQPEEANQQPSGSSDTPEGSTTRCESLMEMINTHERGAALSSR